ncbi:MAG: SpoIIE family protein phosphatase [Thermoguttaceae bacterium]
MEASCERKAGGEPLSGAATQAPNGLGIGDPMDARLILSSLGDGVYVTDVDRRIVYWNAAAARITGWAAEDMIDRYCYDNLLSHVDKDGHQLCGQEYCPLHRSIVTGAGSGCPLVFALRKDGRRMPLQVTVAPIRNQAGEIIGGVEVFRDISSTVRDLERAKAIQSVSLEQDLPHDARIRFETHYIPHDVVGGDFYGIRRLDADRYGFFLADVMGHGLTAALYTMHLSSLWDRYHPLVESPLDFLAKLNDKLCRIVKGGDSFAAAACGLVDARRRHVILAAAGNPPPLVVRAAGQFEQVECAGLPLGVMEDAPYEQIDLDFSPGDRLLLFSDGATEIHDAENDLLGVDGLVAILKQQGYPGSDIQVAAVEEQLLKYSNAVRLDDDLTLIEVCFAKN